MLHYTHSPKLSFEGGGEVAFNFREQQVALTVNGTPVPLPSSDVRVEELFRGFEDCLRKAPRLIREYLTTSRAASLL